MGKRILVVVVNLVVIVGILGLLEYATRVIEAKRLGASVTIPSAYMDRWTAWRNAPGYTRADIHHNGQGFRHDAEVSLAKPPNTVRIFFTGGSAAYGCEGLLPRDLDPDWKKLYNRDLIDVYLEKRLRKEHPERNWEVINAATNEFRMHQTFSHLFADLIRYKPDLVVFFDGHNDMSGIIGSTAAQYDPYLETPHQLEFDSMVYPHTFQSWLYINAAWLKNESLFFRLAQAKMMVQKDQFGHPWPDVGQPVHSPVAFSDLMPALQRQATLSLSNATYYARMVGRLRNALAYEGIESLFVMQPELILSQKPLTPAEKRMSDYYKEKISGPYITYMYENLAPEIVKQVSARAQKENFDFLDLGGVFRGVSEKTFTDYCHLTPRGNELIADAIYREMVSTAIPKLVSAEASAVSK